MWKVYKLVNISLSECFAGVTDGDPQAELRRAADGEIEAVDYWDGDEHRIELSVAGEFPGEMEAVEFLGDLVDKDKCRKAL
jgi:hypothetical protein